MTDRRQVLTDLKDDAEQQRRSLYSGYESDPMNEIDKLLERQIRILSALVEPEDGT